MKIVRWAAFAAWPPLILTYSGAPHHQVFRKGKDSRAGSLEPLPEGRWYVNNIA